MPLLDITNPKVITFLLENYEKESRLRIKWIKQHDEQIRKAATFRGASKNYTIDDVNKSLMVAGMATITRDHAVAAHHRMTAPVKDYLLAKVCKAKPVAPPMTAIKREESAILRESRKEYLKARNKKGPEDKFNFVECVSWQYGWKLGDSEIKVQCSAHGRVCHMLRNLQSRVGPQPDPDYYASADTSYNICAT